MPSQVNLYNARLAKVNWFVKRFGAAELIKKPVRLLLAPLIIPLLPRTRFCFQDRELEYFYHAYNMTWATERCIEVPIGRFYTSQFESRETLEIGNVLSHYGSVAHDVLDKFEKGPKVINEDIVRFVPARKYRLMLSISTFEHIGYDDDSAGESGERILAAVEACRRMLLPEGLLVLTVPIGYNPSMDRLLRDGDLHPKREYYYERKGRRDWGLAAKANVLQCQYGKPYAYANGLVVVELTPKTAKGIASTSPGSASRA